MVPLQIRVHPYARGGPRGNDIASAVAHRLFTAGYPVVILETSQPLTVRRGMAYASAVYDGGSRWTGWSQSTPRPRARPGALQSRRPFPWCRTRPEIVALLEPRVMWMPAAQEGAERFPGHRRPLVIGLVPASRPGSSPSGHRDEPRTEPGSIITEGEADAYTGEPVEIAGHGKDRYLYAPRAGMFRTSLDLGAVIQAGQIVAASRTSPSARKSAGWFEGS